jgi:hypothetical protein
MQFNVDISLYDLMCDIINFEEKNPHFKDKSKGSKGSCRKMSLHF